ncbi:MAG: PKD domain-containing protein [Planctomycetes bacterium]|nr:PKD domain-containing protein [Planctomycetota bacterium]
MPRLLVCAGLLLASAASAQINLPPFGSTFTSPSATRGFWFTAPVPFVITGLRVPNEAAQPFQVVEVVNLGTTPPPVFSGTVNGTQMFYSNNQASGLVIPCTITVQAGEVIGVLGACTNIQGGGTHYSSYGTPAGSFASDILGNPVTLTRFGTQFGIAASGGNNPVWQEPGGALSRIEMFVQPASGLYANFQANVTAGPAPLTVNFADTSFTSDPNGITSWAWDFNGDNVVDSTAQNPSWTYNACGAYDVSLTVTDGTHAPSTTTRTGYIQVGISPITPSFTFTALAPNVFQFTDTSVPAPASWAWDLDGDGITDSTAQNPVWAYASPCTSVNVRLQVSSTCAGPWSTTRPLVLSPAAATAVPFLGGNGTSGAAYVGNMFDLVVTNSSGITVCALTQGIYNYSGPFQADVYVTEGSYLGKEANPGAWRLVASGSGVSAGGPVTPSTPYPVALNAPFHLPAGNYGMVVFLSRPGGAMNVSYTNGPQGPIVTPDVTFFPNPAGAPGRVSTTLFTGTGIVSRCWNGTLHYSTRNNGDLAGFGFFAPGCAGTLPVSRMVQNRMPALGTTMTVTLNNLPQSAALLLTGFSRTASPFGPLPLNLAPYGAPGCTGRVSPDASLFLFGAGNTVTWNLSVPVSLGLIGVQMYNQALVLDPGFNALGAVLSDAAGLMIGQ